ncbi:hypothetical protein [Oceaniglobus trochenteri]|uniref:hypothetical protein n=1 Tax=Oceaniglobus trochenteri TaxID=2763260 RepID=UPI001CFFE545|nr:hypothetical protein [Oceaniglobus trochenteri]
MTDTYAINTTRGREFEVEAEIIAMGLKPWVPRLLASRYIKEKREAVWYDRAYVPKLMFCVIPAIYWRDVFNLKHVIGKPLALRQRDIDGVPAYQRNHGDMAKVPAVPGLRQFKEAVEAEYADAARRRDNSEYQCQYLPGQALQLLDGPFAGFDATFQAAVKKAHDDYAKLRVEVHVFGRPTTLNVDPDKVAIR